MRRLVTPRARFVPIARAGNGPPPTVADDELLADGMRLRRGRSHREAFVRRLSRMPDRSAPPPGENEKPPRRDEEDSDGKGVS